MSNAMMGPAQLGPNLDKCSDTPSIQLGTVVLGAGGKAYRYVKFVDAVTYVKGHVVTLASATDWQVTNDRSGGSAIAGLRAVGVVFQDTVPTQNQYGWVQFAGLASVLIAGSGVAIGDMLVPDASVDGAVSELSTTFAEKAMTTCAMAVVAGTDTQVSAALLEGML